MARQSNQRIRVPNERNAKLMATEHKRPFRRDAADAPVSADQLKKSKTAALPKK